MQQTQILLNEGMKAKFSLSEGCDCSVLLKQFLYFVESLTKVKNGYGQAMFHFQQDMKSHLFIDQPAIIHHK